MRSGHTFSGGLYPPTPPHPCSAKDRQDEKRRRYFMLSSFRKHQQHHPFSFMFGETVSRSSLNVCDYNLEKLKQRLLVRLWLSSKAVVCRFWFSANPHNHMSHCPPGKTLNVWFPHRQQMSCRAKKSSCVVWRQLPLCHRVELGRYPSVWLWGFQ